MKKNIIGIFSIVLFLCSTIGSYAQNDLSKTDDIGRIVLSPYVVSNANIPDYAISVLNNKLTQIVAKQGMAGNSVDKRFIITANLSEVTRDITPTAPPMIALTVAPTIYIGDAITGDLFSSSQLPNVKGVGENETKAYLNAIKNINVNSPAVVQCINEGKEKIIEYYNSQIDFLLAEAESLAQSQQYEDAMIKLATVPNICKDAYLKAYEKIGEIYQRKIDLEGDKLYNEAYAQWKTAKTEESAQKVVELVAQINPLSAAAPKSRTLVKSVEAHYSAIAARRREIEERNWQFKMRQYEDQRADIVAEKENDHEYRMQKANFDYDVEMEKARSSADAALFALQEVKGVVATMNDHSGRSGKSGASSKGNGASSKGNAVSNYLENKITSWFK